ncbi:MAG: Fic family protein [Candidatus Nanopelagicales bacterium]|nr:Fic family protein [Candidatus Nanopelagicales bacterium]
MTWNRERPYNELPALPPDLTALETTRVLKAVTEARVQLARLDQATDLMPDPTVLINTIPLLEAQASSEIENIVTTADALFKAAQVSDGQVDPAVKETLRYRTALRFGFESMTRRTLTARTAAEVCSHIRGITTDVRTLPGTRIANPATGDIIYSPPEGAEVIHRMLANWERFIHARDGLDPIVKMATAHYQFEAIHPFFDGNGRTGRIINMLILNSWGLLRLPILYLSRYVIEHKNDYYSLLDGVTAHQEWEAWNLYMIEAVRQSAESTTRKVLAIRDLQADFHARFETAAKGMSNIDFLRVLFSQPYSRIGDVTDACHVTRQTASSWLDALAREGALVKIKAGRDRLFLNQEYLDLLVRREDVPA